LARSEEGILIKSREDKAYLMFILLTPLHLPHLQVRLLARIARIMESEYVHQRLLEATTPQEVIEIIRAGETAVLS
jgi:mannitol/fructose-specific phosphotransferase system IIA component (Ntr-type)